VIRERSGKFWILVEVGKPEDGRGMVIKKKKRRAAKNGETKKPCQSPLQGENLRLPTSFRRSLY